VRKNPKIESAIGSLVLPKYAGVLLALLDGKTDVDRESEEIGRLTNPEGYHLQ
jgi:hypothetical protein